MATQLELNIRIRTEQSEEYSISSVDMGEIDHSIQSVSFVDESVSLHIQNLQKRQQMMQSREKGGHTNRSFILIRQNQIEDRRKSSNSMKNSFSKKVSFTLADVPHSNMTQLLSYHRCLNLAKNDLYNRAYGAMFGFLIGDSMGANIINKPYNQKDILQALMMEGGGVMGLKSGEGTDEWEISLALCQGLANCKGVYDRNKIAEKYFQWIQSNPCDLPVLMGIAFSDIRKNKRNNNKFSNSKLGQSLLQGSMRNLKQQSAIGLIRIIPLVIWSINLQEYEFNHIIKQQMKLINPNQFVVETALLYANLLKCILTTGDHLLAYHQAAQAVYNFGSQKLADLWNLVQQNKQLSMTNLTANNLKFPFIFAINEMLEIDTGAKDMKKQFIQSAVRVLSKGFNTDTNCSISLGLVGAIIGYNNIPSYFRQKILNAQYKVCKKIRSRDYNSRRIVQAVNQLLKDGPVQLQNGLF